MAPEIFELKKNKCFTIAEARALLPVIKRITHEAVDQVTHLEEEMTEANPEPALQVRFEEQLSDIVQRWSNKVTKLGAIPKGFWLVDFDNGTGYFCWKYNETALDYFHDYAQGFSGRTPLN